MTNDLVLPQNLGTGAILLYLPCYAMIVWKAVEILTKSARSIFKDGIMKSIHKAIPIAKKAFALFAIIFALKYGMDFIGVKGVEYASLLIVLNATVIGMEFYSIYILG